MTKSSINKIWYKVNHLPQECSLDVIPLLQYHLMVTDCDIWFRCTHSSPLCSTLEAWQVQHDIWGKNRTYTTVSFTRKKMLSISNEQQRYLIHSSFKKFWNRSKNNNSLAGRLDPAHTCRDIFTFTHSYGTSPVAVRLVDMIGHRQACSVWRF